MNNDIVEYIKTVAAQNYEKGYGWQVIIECMSNQDIEEQFIREGWSIQKTMSEVNSFADLMQEAYSNAQY
jgi:hypothetical protein